MPLKLKPNSVIKASLGIERGGKIHAFFTAECARYMDEFVPYDEGNLAGTVIKNGTITSNVKPTYIVYSQPYAEYQYYGMRQDGTHVINPENRNRNKHPLATTYWDKHMWTAYSDEIVKNVQKKLKEG